jgi:uncharacterized OB-fold protein
MNATDRIRVMRRYCPACGHYCILPGAEACFRCQARASRDYPTYVDIGTDHPDAASEAKA